MEKLSHRVRIDTSIDRMRQGRQAESAEASRRASTSNRRPPLPRKRISTRNNELLSRFNLASGREFRERSFRSSNVSTNVLLSIYLP